jgi:predicted Zn-dependent protease with MMP-like domain
MREAVRGPVKAAAATAFIVGTLLFLLNPPSLSGAEGMVQVLMVGGSIAIVAAWATVALMGRDAISEADFEKVVLRTEELARSPDLAAQATDFELLVADAIDDLPDNFRELLETTPVVVSHRGVEHSAYGYYMGDTAARDNYPDRIVLFQDTLERDFGYDRDLLRAQVERTLRHELAHHLGWRERGVRELGL